MTSHFSGYCHCGFHAQFGVCTWAATAAARVRAQQFPRSNPFRGWVRSHTVPVFACPVQKESCPGSPRDGLDLSICFLHFPPTCYLQVSSILNSWLVALAEKSKREPRFELLHSCKEMSLNSGLKKLESNPSLASGCFQVWTDVTRDSQNWI